MPLLLLLFGAACGADGNTLEGSIDADLTFDTVVIQRQVDQQDQLVAMIVIYARAYDDPTRRQIPAKLVVNAPVNAGAKKDLTGGGGTLTRVMSNGSGFPGTIASGSVTFDALGLPGEEASGAFWITFSSGSSLNGEFSGTVQALKL